jgi:tetratricopeptide (TPR) repeat protein
MLGENDEALNSYYKAVRVSNLKKKDLNDALLSQRMGGILIQKKKWEDAKVVFEMCANKYETAYSYLNLGIACCYLGDYQNAENLLKKANILDTSNADVWGFMALVMIKKGPRVYNAYQSMKQAVFRGINNSELMYDVSHGFAKLGSEWTETARKTLEYTLLTRATYDNAKRKQKVQEFLLQVSKIHAEFERQKDQNNEGYKQQADE